MGLSLPKIFAVLLIWNCWGLTVDKGTVYTRIRIDNVAGIRGADLLPADNQIRISRTQPFHKTGLVSR
jgi:hypothetical protein